MRRAMQTEVFEICMYEHLKIEEYEKKI